MLRAFEAAAALVVEVRRSKDGVDDIVQSAFADLLTTKGWDPSSGSFIDELVRVVRGLLDVGRGDGRAGQGDMEARSAEAAREIEELKARVAGHPVAPGVLRCRADGRVRAGEIARELRVEVEQVFAATKLLRYHLGEIRARERPEPPLEETR